MIPFDYHNAQTVKEAATLIDHRSVQAIAGGTTMIDLMKLNVLTPASVVHVRDALPSGVSSDGHSLNIGAATTMAELADAEKGGRAFPVIRQSLILAASPQIRNMATIGGNLLQRTRSPYYRHPDMPIDGHTIKNHGEGVDTAMLAVLGNNGRLVGMYPGDFAISAVAFDAELELSNGEVKRRIKARDFYQTPQQKEFQYSTKIKPNEVITSVIFPVSASLKNSYYFKIRERSSYAFALASAAVGLEIHNGAIRSANVGIGGLGSIPWHSKAAEQALIGQAPTDEVFRAAAQAALASAQPPAGLEYKVLLAKRTLERALQTLRDEGPLDDDALWARQHGRSDTQPTQRGV
ncbi:FAD binding domain-containing protein [uncultured Gilvimarinus sp.]|uniref:FAD binding domain-containing protein n=1 Tax=uncultured Gilvimarinus sp. TaxID=1689143 RepID=UPI0030ECAE41